MSKTVWFFHHYASLPDQVGLKRPALFSARLKKDGYQPVIFASSYQHFSGKNMIGDGAGRREIDSGGVPFIFVRTRAYGGALMRLCNMLQFYFGLFKSAKWCTRQHGKPDIIIASSPHPLAMVAGIQIARRYRVPCVCEVRDLWPEVIFRASGLKETGPIGKLLLAGEHWIYRRADALLFTKEGDSGYLVERGWDRESGGDIDINKCRYINNGVELAAYSEQIISCVLDDARLKDGRFKVIYTGTVRLVNDVGNIVEAAALLKEHDDICFLIYGDGNERPALEARAAALGLTNIVFCGMVDSRYIPYILSRSSVNLLNYSGTKYNWSRGNSSNKLFEYMASGKPVISTVKMGYSLIERYGCGVELDESTPEKLAGAVLAMKAMPREAYEAMCQNAARGAEDFDYGRLSEKLEALIDSLTGQEEAKP